MVGKARGSLPLSLFVATFSLSLLSSHFCITIVFLVASFTLVISCTCVSLIALTPCHILSCLSIITLIPLLLIKSALLVMTSSHCLTLRLCLHPPTLVATPQYSAIFCYCPYLSLSSLQTPSLSLHVTIWHGPAIDTPSTVQPIPDLNPFSLTLYC